VAKGQQWTSMSDIEWIEIDVGGQCPSWEASLMYIAIYWRSLGPAIDFQ